MLLPISFTILGIIKKPNTEAKISPVPSSASKRLLWERLKIDKQIPENPKEKRLENANIKIKPKKAITLEIKMFFSNNIVPTNKRNITIPMSRRIISKLLFIP